LEEAEQEGARVEAEVFAGAEVQRVLGPLLTVSVLIVA